MRKKILFIIPYIPYPLDSGGNQAFFNMVEYLRHKMSVSVLLYPETEKRMQVSIRPRACFSPSYNKVKSQTKHVWLLTLL